jgi:beta-lactamase regulating signal transducer with metallopeptidase domain
MMSYFWKILTSHGSFDFLTLLALAAAKATLLLACAALLCFVFRRLSAAARHLLWASALCAALLLPFLSFIKMWDVPILPSRMLVLADSGAKELNGTGEEFEAQSERGLRDLTPSLEASATMHEASDFQTKVEPLAASLPAPNASELQAPPQKSLSLWPQLLNFALAVWVAGVLLFLLKLLAGFIATNLLTRRAVEFEDPSLTALFSSLLLEVNLKRTVRLLRSERTSMPIVYGILRPAVLLPAEAEAWSEERRRMVLLHELTHVTRRDCLTQMLAQMACAFYWFNPFIWFAARRLRVEREQACDDYVLSIGTKPSDYANHLLDIARSMQERSIFEWTQTTSVAMARRSQLEGRLLAILSKENKRGAVSRVAAMGLVALICVLLLSLAVVRPTVIHAQNPQTSQHASQVEKENIESALTDSFVNIEAKAREAGGKQESIAATFDSSQEQALKDTQSEQELGRNVQEADERTVEEVAEVVTQQTATVVQMPEVKPSIEQDANPIINAGYRQDRNTQTQGRSGDFIDEMASAGYTNLSVDELIRLKMAGVNADYVRSLRALGFANLTSKELATMSLHGVTAAYIQSIRTAGYSNLSAKELTTFRIHSITPEYINTLRDAGYGNLPAKQLMSFAVHGITPAFINGIRAAGYGNVPAKDLVSLRIFGVTPEFIRKARSRLGELTVKQLISLKNIGILEDEKGKEKDKERDKERDKEKDKG